MATQSSLKIQNISTVGSTLLTLGANNAKILSTAFGTTLGHPFLIKKIRMNGIATFVDDGDGNLCVGLARGDATVAEIASALNEFNAAGPQDTTESLTEDEVWTVFQKSLVWGKSSGGVSDQAADLHEIAFNDEISFGKGIPAVEDQGVVTFIYNGGPTMTTGALASLHAQFYGVWLN